MSVFDKGVERQVRQTTAKEDIQASKIRQQLAPDQAALSAATTQSGLQILPRKTQAVLGDLNGQIQLQPAVTQDALDKLEQAKKIRPAITQDEIDKLDQSKQLRPGSTANALAQQGTSLPENQLLQAEAQADPTGANTEARKKYQLFTGGKVLRDSTGAIDYKGMADHNEQVNAALMQAQLPIPPKVAADIKAMEPYGPAAVASLRNPDGTWKDDSGRQAAMLSAKPALKPEDIQKESTSLIGISQGITNLDRAAGILKSDPDAVGGKYNQGSAVGQFGAKAGTLAGMEGPTARANNQRILETDLADGILNTIQTLRGTGPIRNTELEQIAKKQPALGANIAQWNTWISDMKANLTKEYHMRRESLPGAAQQNFTPTPPGAPAAPAPAPAANTNPKGLPVIQTMEQKAALPKGSYYWDPIKNTESIKF